MVVGWFEHGELALLRIERATPVEVEAVLDGPVCPPAGASGTLRLVLGGRQLAAVRACVEHHQDDHLWLSLKGVELSEGIALAQLARRLQSHTKPVRGRSYREKLVGEHVGAVLRLLLEQGAPVQVEDHELALLPERHDAGSEELTFRTVGEAPVAPFMITATGYNSIYRIPIEYARLVGDRLIAAYPPWIECLRARRARRVATVAEKRVVFDHPLWPAVRIDSEMVDLSHDGLSFRASANTEAVYPGLSTDQMFVESPGGERIHLLANVVSYRRLSADEGWVFGCQVHPATSADRQLWQRLCEARLFPTTRRGAADVWNVYRSSGYLALSETIAGEFDHLRAAYEHTSRALSAAPELGCQASWPAHGEPRATLTNLKLYPSSWFSYHLAVQPDQALAARSAEILRDLYRQYVEHCLALPGPRWQMAYVQHSAHWSMRVHVDLPLRYQEQNEALVMNFQALEVRTVGHAAQPVDRYVGVRRASPEDMREVLPLLCARRDPIYCDALDYRLERFDLAGLKAEWARHGLERDRELFVAYRAGQPIAAAVTEAAEPGLHLFGLLDTLRMYALATGGESVFGMLLDRARAWFRQRGRRTFCYLEEERCDASLGADVKPLSQAYLTLLSVERLPEMLERLYSDTARS